MTWAVTSVGRCVRATTLAVLAVTMSVTAHVIACGQAPSVPVTVVGALLGARICWGSSDRRMSPWRIGMLVLGVQASLHVGFAVTGASPARHLGHLGHLAHPAYSAPGGRLATVGQVGGPVTVPSLDMLPGGPGMAVCHLAAALALTGWLAVGERVLWRVARGATTVARGVARRLRRTATRRPAVYSLRFVPVRRRSARRARGLVQLSHVVVRRGPPNAATA